MNAEPIDLLKLHWRDYAAPTAPIMVELKRATYLSIGGEGEPGGADFLRKIGALQSVAVAVKMTRKGVGQRDYAIPPLEAQLYAPNETFLPAWEKYQWRWKLLLRTPDSITPADLSQAVTHLTGNGDNSLAKEVQLEALEEGLCVQMLHVGPVYRQGETVFVMEMFAQKLSLIFSGRHHTIYLSDPRSVAPEEQRTIVRIPVARE